MKDVDVHQCGETHTVLLMLTLVAQRAARRQAAGRRVGAGGALDEQAAVGRLHADAGAQRDGGVEVPLHAAGVEGDGARAGRGAGCIVCSWPQGHVERFPIGSKPAISAPW